MNISVLNDACVPGAENYRIRYQVNVGNLTKVADFIDANTRKWKTELVFNTFPADNDMKILKIQLAVGELNDLNVWQ